MADGHLMWNLSLIELFQLVDLEVFGILQYCINKIGAILNADSSKGNGKISRAAKEKCEVRITVFIRCCGNLSLSL